MLSRPLILLGVLLWIFTRWSIFCFKCAVWSKKQSSSWVLVSAVQKGFESSLTDNICHPFQGDVCPLFWLIFFFWAAKSYCFQLMNPYNLHVLQNCSLVSPPSWICAVEIAALVEELYVALLNCILFFSLLHSSSPFQVGLQMQYTLTVLNLPCH